MKHLGTNDDLVDVATQKDISDAVAGIGGYPSYPAGETISGHRVVRLLLGKVVYVDPTIAGSARLLLGVSQNAAMTNDPVVVQTSGVMTEPSWSWVADMPVFCGPSGGLTQVAPATGTLLTIGTALSPTQIHIRPEPTITLN